MFPLPVAHLPALLWGDVSAENTSRHGGVELSETSSQKRSAPWTASQSLVHEGQGDGLWRSGCSHGASPFLFPKDQNKLKSKLVLSQLSAATWIQAWRSTGQLLDLCQTLQRSQLSLCFGLRLHLQRCLDATLPWLILDAHAFVVQPTAPNEVSNLLLQCLGVTCHQSPAYLCQLTPAEPGSQISPFFSVEFSLC